MTEYAEKANAEEMCEEENTEQCGGFSLWINSILPHNNVAESIEAEDGHYCCNFICQVLFDVVPFGPNIFF